MNLSALDDAIKDLMTTVHNSLLRLAENGPNQEVYAVLDGAIEQIVILATELMEPGRIR